MFEVGQIVFINGRLVVMNSEGAYIKYIPFQGGAVDVSVIDTNTVAVTLSEKKCISIVDVNTTHVIRRICN